jgi:hypothetical protein
MIKATSALLGASFVLAGATSVSAQETRPIGLSLRGGLFFGEGDTDPAFGAEFKLKDVNWEGIGEGYLGSFTLSLDHFGDTTPAMLNFVARKNEWYWTGGAGFMMGDDPGLGFQLGLGYDFARGQTPLFVEGKYWFGSSRSGLGVYLGVRL